MPRHLVTDQHLARFGAVAAIAGSVLLFAATMLHPIGADPNDAAAAFAEYAADPWWIASHLGQFLGASTLAVAVLAGAATIERGPARACARIAGMGAAASVAITAALQAVDGVALRHAVLRWAGASGDDRARAFESAWAIRQVEIGLAGLTSLTFGLTVVVLGAALVMSSRYPAWLGWLGIAGGLGTLGGGVAQAYTGFSPLAMTISMPASVVLLMWAVLMGAFMWRLAPRLVNIRLDQSGPP